jgi:hypothetical protein
MLWLEAGSEGCAALQRIAEEGAIDLATQLAERTQRLE